jgi:ubiquinone/menaquinone biosynthesis C-methylase UbiE
LIGRIASGGDPSTYGYLLKGVREFPDQEAFADELRAAGFADVVYHNLTFGIVAIHEATKPC